MRRLLLLLVVVAVAAISCQEDIVCKDIQYQQDVANKQASPYAVSEEEALTHLDAFMSIIGASETRSVQRKIKNIQTIKYSNVSVDTRTNESEVDNLLYVVEFDNGQGSAVLGADRRVDNVFAVLESGVLSVGDFEGTDVRCDDEKLEMFLVKLIVNEAVDQVNESNQSTVNSSPKPLLPLDTLELSTDICDYVDVRNVYNYVAPMLRTKWNQSEPFNEKFPMTSDHNTTEYKPYAGCGAIAMAQLMVYHRLSNTVTLNGNKYYYDDLALFTYDNIDNVINNDYLANQLQYFIYDVAEEMNSKYYPEGTSTSSLDAARVMRKVGFHNVLTIINDEDIIKEMIDDGRPVYLRGADDMDTNNLNDNVGHCWILDGRICYSTTTYIVTKRDGVVVDREVFYSSPVHDYVHCNFGWGGEYDGYYNYNIYDVCNIRPQDMLEPGDIVSNDKDRVYDVGLWITKYN